MAAHVADCNSRGCALANAAVELPEKDHPARAVIEECKRRQRDALIRLCDKAGLTEPEMLADEFLLLIEGARVTAQSMGARRPRRPPHAHERGVDRGASGRVICRVGNRAT